MNNQIFFLLVLYIPEGYKHINVMDSLLCLLITLVISLQMNTLLHHPFIFTCKVPMPGPWKCTHRNQLNRDMVPCLCQVFLLRRLFAGVVTNHLQEKQTLMKQRHSREKTPPAKIPHIKTGIVANSTKHRSVEPSRQWQAEKRPASYFINAKTKVLSSLYHAP